MMLREKIKMTTELTIKQEDQILEQQKDDELIAKIDEAMELKADLFRKYGL